MVGPFMQGMLLLGIMYWYSKGMLNMINDYYRSEFQKQLETSKADKKPVGEDEIEVLLKKSDTSAKERQSLLSGDIFEGAFCPVGHESDVCFDETELNRFLEIALSVCFSNNFGNMLPDAVDENYKACKSSYIVPVEGALKS